MIPTRSIIHRPVRIIATSLLLIVSGLCEAQTVLVPGENVLDKKWLKNGTYEMACYASANGQQVQISTFTMHINADNKALKIYTALQVTGTNELWMDTSIAEGSTFKPIYRSSHSQVKDMVVHFGKEVTGYYYDKQTRKRHTIQEAGQGFFDNYAYPFLLGMLPLTTGYRNDLAVYEFKPGNETNTKRARIEEVKSNIYVSKLTGEHKVWQVNVFEENTNDSYAYYIDKESRRLWKVEIKTNGRELLLLDQEIDHNPFTTTFDKVQTMKLIKEGHSIILGQAFARDNQNEGMLKGIAVLNINKKQLAKQGTTVVLIPYTDFFKEWFKLNEVSRKKGRAIPLPKEATDCIKVTTVYDNEGHFEFTNLLPGDFLLYTEFGYVHTSIRTEVTGYTDTYINGLYQGSRENTTVNAYNGNAAASIKKVVTIKNDGDKLEIKLKKTL